MKIGFIGYGSMTKALAPRFKAAGHDVFLGGHHPDKAKAAAEEVGADGSGDTKAAVAFGEVVVMATPHDKVEDAIADAGGPFAFAGKVVVDINNPVSGYMDGDFTVATLRRQEPCRDTSPTSCRTPRSARPSTAARRRSGRWTRRCSTAAGSSR